MKESLGATTKDLWKVMVVLTLFIALIVGIGTRGEANSGSSILQVRVHSIPTREGMIAYSLFSSKVGFPRDSTQAVRKGFLSIPKDGDLTIELPDLPFGTYALALFIDDNENKKLDKNFLGVPKESIGFSNNPKVRFGPPKFQDASFTISTAASSIDVEMLH